MQTIYNYIQTIYNYIQTMFLINIDNYIKKLLKCIKTKEAI